MLACPWPPSSEVGKIFGQNKLLCVPEHASINNTGNLTLNYAEVVKEHSQ
jgi:hypothetical protein